jgi:hypothetical protein
MIAMQPQSPYGPQPHQSSTPTPAHAPQENYTAPETGGPADQTPSQEGREYNFILSPTVAAPTKPAAGLGSFSSRRTLIVVGGVVVLIFMIVILKSVFSPTNPVLGYLMAVAADQQELVHITTNTTQLQNVDTTTLNSAYTINLSITAQQQQLLSYLSSSGYKGSSKLLNAKVSASVDTELTNADTNGNYDQVYQTVIQNDLATYGQDIKAAYAQLKGHNGRALLLADYKSEQLLAEQLTSPAG